MLYHEQWRGPGSISSNGMEDNMELLIPKLWGMEERMNLVHTCISDKLQNEDHHNQ